MARTPADVLPIVTSFLRSAAAHTTDPSPVVPCAAVAATPVSSGGTTTTTTTTNSSTTTTSTSGSHLRVLPDVNARVVCSAQTAAAAIAAVPVLCDVARELSWPRAFQPEHGPLLPFVLERFGSFAQQMARARAATTASDTGGLRSVFLEGDGGAVVRVAPVALTDASLQSLEPRELAGALVFEALHQGGSGAVEKALLHRFIAAAWQSWATRRLCAHLWAAIGALPRAFVCDLGVEVLVSGARRVDSSIVAVMHDMATSVRRRVLLRLMGQHAGIPEWTNVPLVDAAPLSRTPSASISAGEFDVNEDGDDGDDGDDDSAEQVVRGWRMGWRDDEEKMLGC